MRGRSERKGSLYSFSSTSFFGTLFWGNLSRLLDLCAPYHFPSMQIYQDQNRSLKLDFHANRTSRRYITLPMFLLSMRLPLPGILISSSRSSDGEKRRCMRWANGNVAMVFPLGAFHSVFLFLSFHNCRSFVHPLDSCFRSRSRADPVYFLFRSKFRSNLTYFNFS